VGAGDKVMFGSRATKHLRLMGPLPIQPGPPAGQEAWPRCAKQRPLVPISCPMGKNPGQASRVRERSTGGDRHPADLHPHTAVIDGISDEAGLQRRIADGPSGRHVVVPATGPIDDPARIAAPPFLVNPTGKRFVVGGPRAIAGLTARKSSLDTYGGHRPHGGGASPARIPPKVDALAAYAARHVAKMPGGRQGLAERL